MTDWPTTVLVAVATLVWIGNFVVAVLDRDYQASEAINGIMLAIIGGVFASRRRKDGRDE